MEFGRKNNVLLLVCLAVMISKTICKPYLKDDWMDRMMGEPGYSSDNTGVEEESGMPSSANWYDRMQVDPGYVSDIMEDSVKPVKGCGGKLADIYFLLDASDRVGKEDFERSLEYASDLVPTFDPARTRIGAVTYNDASFSKVYLGEYRGAKLQTAIQRLPFEGGEPDTGSALRYMRRKAFSPNVARSDAVHMVIVVTNGFSRNSKDLLTEAKRLQKSGVYVFVVYTDRNADVEELTAIASQPNDNFMFSVNSYNIVAFTEYLLGSSPCDFEVHPAGEKKVCDTRRPADIVFGLDYATIGVKKAKKVLKFIKQSMDEFDIGSDRIHVGVVTNDCPLDLDINLEEHYTSDGILKEADALKMPSQSDMLRKVRRRSFSTVNRARKDVQQTLVLFIDDKLDNPTKVILEALRTKARKIQIIVVAIGSRLNVDNLTRVATRDSVVKISSYDDLMSNKDNILELICRGL